MTAPKSWAALTFFLLLIPAAIGIGCGERITKPTTLSQDLACQSDGLIISGGSLECQGHAIKGSGVGIGIQIIGEESYLSTCAIQRFDLGLILNNSRKTQLTDIKISDNNIGLYANHDNKTSSTGLIIDDNAIGMYLDESSIDINDVRLSNNNNDIFITPAQIGKATAAPDKAKPQPPKPASTPTETINVALKEPTSEALALSGIKNWQAIAGLHSVAAGKKITLLRDRTRVDITIRPQKDVKDLQAIEYIPKSIAPNSKTIISSSPQFEVIDEDLTVMFRLGDVKAGTEKNITYTIDHRLARDLAVGPFTIISIVEEISPELEGLVAIMSVLFAGMLAYYQYLRYKAKKESSFGIYTAMYIIALACATLLGYVQLTFTLPPKETAQWLAAALGVAIIITIIRILLIKKEISSTKPKGKKKKRAEEPE